MIKSYGNRDVEITGTLPTILQPILGPLEAELLPLKQPPHGFGFKYYKRDYGLEVFHKPIPHDKVQSQSMEKAKEISESILRNIYGSGLSSNPLIARTNVLYAKDFERGEEMDISTGIALLRSIKYLHYHDEIRIEGDLLAIAVADNEVVKIRACWHKVKGIQKSQKKKVKNVEESLPVAVEDLSKKFSPKKKTRQQFRLQQASLCYYGFHETGKSQKLFMPTWHFTFEKNKRFYDRYVNAHSNKAMNFESDFAVARRKQAD